MLTWKGAKYYENKKQKKKQTTNTFREEHEASYK